MRILFSSDWHLGYELGGANRQSRLADQLRNVRRIGEYCVQREVDVLAVAGDVFEAQERGRARIAVQGMLDALAPALDRGMRIVMIAGNHDRDFFMETANLWLGVERAGHPRFTLVTKPSLEMVEAGGERVNFLLLPFPTQSRYDLALEGGGALAQKNEQIARGYVAEMERLQAQAKDARLPVVLLTHVTVDGTDVKAHRISPHNDVVVPFGAFPSFEMTVVGHIHKAEKKGGGHFYYVGALDRMDIGEREYEPRVLLADIGPKGVRSVESLPLDPTPFADLVVESADEMHEAAAQIDRLQETLVRLTLRVPYGTYTAPLLDEARKLFPRLYGDVVHDWIDAPDIAASIAGLDPADVAGNVRRYLTEHAKNEAERADLFALVDELMTQEDA